MKKGQIVFLYFLFALLIFSSSADAAVINVASCSQSNVQNGIDSAANGDTVRLAGGTCTWSSSVSIPNTKGITLDGNGAIITGKVDIDLNSATSTRLTRFTFRNSPYINGPFAATSLEINGNKNSAPFRVDNNVFTTNLDSIMVDIVGITNGLFDHNSFTAPTPSEMIHNLGAGNGNNAGWLDDVTPGSWQMIYLEDNSFSNNGPFQGNYAGAHAAIQNYYGARVVFRYNDLSMSHLDVHGTAGMIGGRWWEIYNNHFSVPSNGNQADIMALRAGSGVVFGNTHSQPGSSILGGIDLEEEDSGYPALYQVGRGRNQALSPAYFWNNSKTVSVDDGDIQINRDYYVSANKPASMLRQQLSTDTASTTYVYTPFVYPYPLDANGMPNPTGSGSSTCTNCRYVRQGATGTNNGSDWTNAYTTLPATLTRGYTYYIADGSYLGYTFDDAVSGTQYITIKKAIASDHGTDTGWQSTYGDGQAIFNGGLRFTSSNWIFNGQTGGGPGAWNSNYGFKVIETDDGTTLLWVGWDSVANNIAVSHVDLQGKGSESNQGGSYSNDGISISQDSNITLSYAWMHGIGRCPVFFMGGGGPAIFEYIYVQSFFAGSNVHGEVMSASGVLGDVTWRNSLITDMQSTGGLMWDNSLTPSSRLYVYGNVFYKPAGAVWDEANGVIGGWTGGNGEEMHNVLVYNNAFINVDQQSLSSFPNIASGSVAYNNLWYNSDAPNFAKFPTHNYNHFINSGTVQGESTGTTSVSDPFLDYMNFDFRLKDNTAFGINLGSPFNIDPLGNSRATWTRGAYEFSTGGSSPSISVQPASQSKYVGESATFSVTASGTGTFSYQWQKNGANIAGATTLSYTTPTLSLSDNNAQYRVIVSNGVGSVTSQNAVLTVTQAPTGNVKYVDNSAGCSNSASFGSEAQPYCTINYALGQISGGDTILIKQSTNTAYSVGAGLTITGPNGLPGQPTTIKAYPGHVPRIVGTGNDGRIAFDNTNYWLIEGLNISNFNHLIAVRNNAYNITFRNNILHDSGGQLVQVHNNAHHVLFENNILYNAGSIGDENGEAFYIGTHNGAGNDFTNNVIIRGNIMNNIEHEAIEFKHDTHDNIAENNIISNVVENWDFGKWAILAFSTVNYNANPNHIIRGNVILNHSGIGTGAAIRVETGSQVYNNIIYNEISPGRGIEAGSGDSYTRYIYHNTIDVPSSRAVINEVGSGAAIVNNIGPSLANNIITSDVFYVNKALGDYHLATGSAPINAGSNVGISVDKDGIVRPQGASFDMGAYEYISSGQSTPSISVQPQSQSKYVGESVTFSVTASGNPAPTYQWRENAVNIAGATLSSYTKSNVQLADSGKVYSVVVSNSQGSVTSSNAVLTVTDMPQFAAPSFIGSYNTSWGTASSKTTQSFAVVAGDVLVAYSAVENNAGTVDVSGGSLNWALEEEVSGGSIAHLYLWTATVDSNKTMSVTFTDAGADSFGGSVYQFRGSSGVGNSASGNGVNPPSLNIATTALNSSIVVANVDYAANSGASRVWRTNAGTFVEREYFLDAVDYTVYGGYHPRVNSVGSYVVGLTAPTQTYSIAAIEIKGIENTVPSANYHPADSNQNDVLSSGEVSSYINSYFAGSITMAQALYAVTLLQQGGDYTITGSSNCAASPWNCWTS